MSSGSCSFHNAGDMLIAGVLFDRLLVCPAIENIKCIGCFETLIEVVTEATGFRSCRLNKLQAKGFNPLGVVIIAAKLADDVPLFGFGVMRIFILDLDETIAGAK